MVMEKNTVKIKLKKDPRGPQVETRPWLIQGRPKAGNRHPGKWGSIREELSTLKNNQC